MTEKLNVVRGVVTTAKERMQSVRFDRKSGYGSINTTPELWLVDVAGKEHRYQGDMFRSARPGHDVAVVTKRSSGKPIAFANFTSKFVHEAKELGYSTTFVAQLIGTLIVTLIFAVPGLFVWGVLAQPFGLMKEAFSAAGFQVYIVVLGACVFAGVKVWSKSYRERTDALKAEIDRLLVAAQTKGK